ncbi:unnamed protein product, partial [Brenthis ino]
MVYLRPVQSTDLKEPNWLCGGVIIHAQYILTSAACIEDVQRFYVISGTHRWLPIGSEDGCIKNGAKRAVWKCVPKDYVFDGKAFNNIRWMENDIAIVKVDSKFDFEHRVHGCDFKSALIAYNDQSEDLESPGTVASIAGWGSTNNFNSMYGRTTNSPDLLETDVILISKTKCKDRWPERYHYIIDKNMICAKDGFDTDSMRDICREQEINCKELEYSNEEEPRKGRRFVVEGEQHVHSARHFNSTRRYKPVSGGFCENDHGGPLISGHGRGAIVIGVISACMTTNITQKCYGPFLYTSVWKNRHVINCAINKDKETTCRRLLRSGKKRLVETNYEWSNNKRYEKQESKSQNKFVLRRRVNSTKKRPLVLQNVQSMGVKTTLPLNIMDVLHKTNMSKVEGHLNNSRRIINGEESRSSRPYMVYLKLPTKNPKYNDYRQWLCGGVIIHEEYILTSAACIEDVKHFYVVSGTYRHNEADDRYNNICIKNGAKKAVWKCIPRNYVFDGHENDNIRWMNNDIAIVKVEDEFNFDRRIRGCDFIPKPIFYNNRSSRYEETGNKGVIAGWGSTDKYNNLMNQRSQAPVQELLESTVVLISKTACKRRWGPRYHNIIDNYMICSRDTNPDLSEVCHDKYVECSDIMYSDEVGSRRVISPNELVLHSAYHNATGRRQPQVVSGGFCEVYLKLPQTNKKKPHYRTWLCGGVIIHEEYILTSAACIEDADHFYVVSGTFKYSDEDDKFNNPCIKNGAKKAVWKCVPKNYVFDGHENDNIRWMNNDIAVVKVEGGFDFNRRIKGCEFVPKPISYNNQSQTLENPGTVVTIAGWGTTSRYNDEKYVDCQDISYSDEEDARRNSRVTERVPENLVLHSAYNDSRRYGVSQADGGFCENDHGGPLVYGSGVNSIVIGVISACLVKERTNKCYGPFLYTSVYKNRQFISCAIYKDFEIKCRRQFRSGVTHVEKVLSWKNHPDGPAMNELNLESTLPAVVQRANEGNVASNKLFSDSGFIIKAVNTNYSKAP